MRLQESTLKCYQRLRPWFQLAGLLPPPPARSPKPLHPLGAFLWTDRWQWRNQCRSEPTTTFVERFERSGLALVPVFAEMLNLDLLRTSSEHGRGLCELAWDVAETLHTLTAAVSDGALRRAGDTPLLIRRRYGTPSASHSEVWVRDGAVTTHWVDPFTKFLDALAGVDAAHVRQCPVCHRLFFAVRKDQKACSKPCNAVRRVRDWRANQAEHEYRRKLKAAGLQPQKRKRRP
jgi:hypothetical protein